MLMFSITKPKKKIKSAFLIICVVLLLAVGVPVTYDYLRDADAMASFAQVLNEDDVIYVTDTMPDDSNLAEIEVESMTGDPIKVNAVDENEQNTESQMAEEVSDKTNEKNIFDRLLEVIFGSPDEIIYYDTK